MNRIVLIGNGFDLAHKLPTSYKDFIEWYWKQLVEELRKCTAVSYDDGLCTFRTKSKYHYLWADYAGDEGSIIYNKIPSKLIQNIKDMKDMFEVYEVPLLKEINTNLANKNWVDIESVYYKSLKKTLQSNDDCDFSPAELNAWLQIIQDKLVEYLKSLNASSNRTSKEFRQIIHGGIKRDDVAIAFQSAYLEHAKYWASQPADNVGWRLREAGFDEALAHFNISNFQERFGTKNSDKTFSYENFSLKDFPDEVAVPQRILILSFNYTPTATLYKNTYAKDVNYIHGSLKDQKSVLFGFGDELDDDYKSLIRREDNELIKNFKSIRYLESDRYRNMLSFLEADTFQVIILGHSCGNSDRTLLNTIFEHPNCASIKPYYYKSDDGSDNYMEIAQSIYRNFTDMKLMRDRVVNKVFCEPMPQGPFNA